MRNVARFALSVGATALFAGCGGLQPPIGATGVMTLRGDSFPHHKTFRYTGNEQSFVVPKSVTSLDVVARGGAGGGSVYYTSRSGRGGRVHAVLPVRPGEKLFIFVGGSGGYDSFQRIGGFNGGGNPGRCCEGAFGGGGASDVRRGGIRINDRILVAAGGGGEGGFECCGGAGGVGGGLSGGDGGNALYGYGDGGGGGGQGGTQYSGGSGGKIWKGYSKRYGRAHHGLPGRKGSGGDGGLAGFGEGSSSDGGAGGGGGGGFYGGGGGGGGVGGWGGGDGQGGGGGAGGSSYVEPDAISGRTWSGWKNATGNGLVVLGWQ